MKTRLALNHPRRAQYGFTLVEMAIVLVVVSLLVGGMLMSLTSQQDIANAKETEKRLNEIRDALLGFAVVNGRLPCPANPTTESGTAGAGTEYAPTAGGCTTSVEGVIPWATLGLPETDAWGRRLTYRVTDKFAGNTTFSLNTSGDIDILMASAGASLASNVPAVVVSHGRNGLRAYLPNGPRMGITADADEAENSDADTDFVSKTPTTAFDDQVVWIAPTILMNRMISAGKLP